MQGKYVKNFFLILIIFAASNVFADVDHHTKLWLESLFIGPFSKEHPKFKYYLEPRIKFININTNNRTFQIMDYISN